MIIKNNINKVKNDLETLEMDSKNIDRLINFYNQQSVNQNFRGISICIDVDENGIQAIPLTEDVARYTINQFIRNYNQKLDNIVSTILLDINKDHKELL